MSELTSIRMKLSKLLAKLSEIETDKGVLTKQDETPFVVGDLVYVLVDGEYKPAEDGDYKAGETIYVVAEGKIVEIRTPEALETEEEDIVNLRKEVNELYAIVDELIKKVESLTSKTDETTEVIEKMSKNSASQPIETFKDIVEIRKNFR